MTRIIGTSDETERIHRILSRYAHITFTKQSILATFSQEDISVIGKILRSLPNREQVLCEPYSFGDLFLEGRTILQKKFNASNFPLQCRVLDVAEEVEKAKTKFALIAVDWNSGVSLLLSVSSKEENLWKQAEGFLFDPLTKTMVDVATEKDLANLIKLSQTSLHTKKANQSIGIFKVRCSEAFFIENIFGFPLDCKFSLRMGKTFDESGHLIPEFIDLC
ncbi:hypothetical protein [uncultured Sphaerochaeta sp.]|uniref:hypothetical protein n=1 Tax=uncultured Sphaerochaeta sp. TaxID=886478 RepID=UPI002A0A9ADB|nr:hypothetical protein [uncultured Sphaerochaeta sp.]